MSQFFTLFQYVYGATSPDFVSMYNSANTYNLVFLHILYRDIVHVVRTKMDRLTESTGVQTMFVCNARKYISIPSFNNQEHFGQRTEILRVGQLNIQYIYMKINIFEGLGILQYFKCYIMLNFSQVKCPQSSNFLSLSVLFVDQNVHFLYMYRYQDGQVYRKVLKRCYG